MRTYLQIFGRYALLAACLLPALNASGQPYQIGERTLIYHDSTRNRPVKAEIWYPTTEQDPLQARNTELPFVLPATIRDASFTGRPHPLVLLSHGTGSNRFGLAWLATELARKGYIVAAPDHWGNTFDHKVPEYFVRYWERPLDMQFLLSALLQEDTLAAQIDDTRIAAAGFSYGGYTALALGGVQLDCEEIKRQAKTKAGRQDFKIPEMGDLRGLIAQISCTEASANLTDERIRAVVAIAPALGLGLNRQQQPEALPVLIVSAERDRVTPPERNALRYHRLLPASVLLSLDGKTGHYTFLNQADAALQKEARRYYRDHRTTNRAAVHRKVAAEVLKFLEEHL